MYTLSDKVRFIEKAFGIAILARNGLNISAKCPNCGYGEKLKFIIRVQDDACHCWVCGIKGRNLAPVLKKYKDRSLLEEYVHKFADDKQLLAIVDEQITQKLRLPADFKLLPHIKKSINPDNKAVIRYIKSRGLSEADMWFYKFGISSDRRAHRRVIFPSFDKDGELNYFVARAIDKDVKPKYVNAPNDKKQIVFNEFNVDWTKEITIVEGPFDLVKCDGNASCLLGSEMAEDTLLFSRIVQNSTPVVLALDDDMQWKIQRIAKRLSEFNVQVKIMPLGDRHDVGEMTRDEFIERKSQAKIWSRDEGILYKISQLRSGSLI